MDDLHSGRGHGGDLKRSSEQYGIEIDKIIDFSSNINPLGMPSAARDVLKDTEDLIKYYPDPDCSSLRESVSGYLKVKPSNILFGNGSDELFFLLFEVLRPKKAMMLSPTYSEYKTAAESLGCEIENFYLNEKNGFKLDLKMLLGSIDTDTELLMICNPNNPTGTLIDKKSLLGILKRCADRGTVLAVDEAFMDFIGEGFSLAAKASMQGNLLVFRSMTKIFAIPGLRLGYMVGPEGLLEDMSGRQQTWPVNSIAQSLGKKALEDKAFIKKSKDFINKEKSFLFDGLEKIDWLKVFEPSVNFILAKITESDLSAEDLSDHAARKYGILIRDCSNFDGLGRQFFRVAVRSRKDNLKLIECLKHFRIKG